MTTLQDSLNFDPFKLVRHPRKGFTPLGYYVYFLFDHAGELVYIGRSSRPEIRVLQHAFNFDEYSVIKIETEEEMKEAERIYIKRYKPRYNSAHVTVNKDQAWQLFWQNADMWGAVPKEFRDTYNKFFDESWARSNKEGLMPASAITAMASRANKYCRKK